MRFVWLCILGLTFVGGFSGCGGVTEKEKEAAEKVPSLEIGDSDNSTSDSSKPEKKEAAESDSAKP